MDARGDDKVRTVMHEYGDRTLHSGSKAGPMVTDRKQALAIALSEAKQHIQRHKDKGKKR